MLTFELDRQFAFPFVSESLAPIVCLGCGMPVFSLPGDGSDSLQMSTRTIQHDGRERLYYLYLPPLYEASRKYPLLLLLHGGGGSANKMVNFTGFDKLAKDVGLIIVCPDGVDRHWNDGREETGHRAEKEQVDDVGFVRKILDTLDLELSIDNQRVFASGISNGAMMSYRLALELPDRIAAIGAVVGALPEPFLQRVWQGRPVPAIIINGTSDPLVPFSGGDVGSNRKKLGRVVSVPDTVAFWAQRNQCMDKPRVTDLPLNGMKSGLTVKKTIYANCRDGADIEFYAVIGGGHTWPRDSLLAQYLPVAEIGKACRDMDSTKLMWDFFTRHSLPNNI